MLQISSQPNTHYLLSGVDIGQTEIQNVVDLHPLNLFGEFNLPDLAEQVA